ncbi:MAG: SGNH/GDSL hydrolase family protein [Myxococcales bacterium]|nr:SGNH/GDSL hydrolase family protein [Myxococcales bacterium]
MADAAPPPQPRVLALGDSYTIGASVEPAERWPAQLVVALRAGGRAIGDPRYIAQSGWTTFALSDAMDREAPVGPFALVTLLIGVNDQFFHEPAPAYGLRFGVLLDRAIGLAGGDACRVVVLSIPDYSVTPFGQGIDPVRIAREIAAFNDVNRGITADKGVRYVDVTPSSQRAADDPGLIADDGLHPSGRMYAVWTALAQPAAEAALDCP